MKPAILIDHDYLAQVLDFLVDLRGEWSWRKDEPRCGYSASYKELDEVIEQITKRLKAHVPRGYCDRCTLD